MQVLDANKEDLPFDVQNAPKSDDEFRVIRECLCRKVLLSFAEESIFASNFLVLNDNFYELSKASPSRFYAMLSMGWGALESSVHWLCASIDEHGFNNNDRPGLVDEWRFIRDFRASIAHPKRHKNVVEILEKKTDDDRIYLFKSSSYRRIPYNLDDVPHRSIGQVMRLCMDDADRFLEERFHGLAGEIWRGPTAKQVHATRMQRAMKYLGTHRI